MKGLVRMRIGAISLRTYLILEIDHRQDSIGALWPFCPLQYNMLYDTITRYWRESS